MDTPPDTQARIFQAADTLYEESGRVTFPTVDAVRKRARVNMNDASTGMRAWRRAQVRTIEAPTIRIPEKIQASIAVAVAQLWSEAVSLANEALRAAQSGWAIEREQSNTVADQMASAFEAQVAALSGAKAENDQLASRLAQQEEALAILREEHATMSRAVLALKDDAARAQERVIEAGQRINDLRCELDHAHKVETQLRHETAAQRLSHETATVAWQTEMTAVREEAQKAHRIMESALREAREQNAILQGELAGIEKSMAFRRKAPRSKDRSLASSAGSAPQANGT